QRVEAECPSDDRAAAGTRSGDRPRSAMAIEQGRGEPGVVDADPRAASHWIDWHDDRTSPEGFDAGGERHRAIATFVTIRHHSEPAPERQDRDSAHQTALRGVAGASPRRSGTSRPVSESRTAIIAWW